MRPTVPPPPLPAHAQSGGPLRGSVASTIRGLAAGIRPSDVWRTAAFALLRLNPKECEALAHVFEDENVTCETRLVVLDLLAGAGTFEAQVIMRRLLALSVARRDNRMFATFVQRLGIVECPDGPTLRFLMSVYAESRGEPQDVRAACAYALGAAAGQAFASGDRDAAVRASDVLRRDLASAATASEKCSLVTALGNAGITNDVTVIARFTKEPDAPVRAAAALALRKLNVAEARAHLLLLLADGEPKVAQSALAALSEHKLDDEEIERLAQQVNAGGTPLGLDMRILRLIVAQRPRLTSALGRSGAIENALRLLLGRVEAAGSTENTLTGSGERRVVFPQPTKFPSVTSASGSAAAMMAAKPGSVPAMAAVKPPAIMATRAASSPKVISAKASTQGPANTPIPAPPRPMSATPPEQPHAQAQYAATVQQSVPAMRQRLRLDATVVDAMPLGARMGPGAYRVVSPGDSLEAVRARMIEMGLDPDGKSSSLPQPPPRRAAASEAPTPAPTRPQTRLNPNAVVRGR